MKSLKDVLFVFTRSKCHTYLKMPPPIPSILRPKANIWYHKISAGRERLGNVVAQVVKSVSFDRYYSNRWWRGTCATRLNDKGLPEQLIQETTGHRSADGVRCYKHTFSSAKRRASEVCELIKERIENCWQCLVSLIISDWFLVLQREKCNIFNIAVCRLQY